MEEILKFAIENGLGVASFVVLALFVYIDKKQTAEDKKETTAFIQSMVNSLNDNTNTLKEVNENQKEISNTLYKMGVELETLKDKVYKKGE